jgi:hypothetical protein
MQAQRSLYWRFNWYRQSELEGALLLGRMVQQVADPFLVEQLTKHCADEARHAWLWTRTIKTLGLPSVRIRRTYQSFYRAEISPPRTITELLALTHIFEQRVEQHFTDELRRAGLPDLAQRTFGVLLRDEQDHLEWIDDWLSAQPDANAILKRYRTADERVVQRLAPYRERLWDIEGLGEELTERSDGEYQTAQEEPHAAERQHSA